METTETKRNIVEEWKSLTIKKKIIYGGIAILSISALLTAITPNVDPCDCADVASKAEIIGYDNLNSKQQKLYRNCESKYTYSGDAYEACINKHLNK